MSSRYSYQPDHSAAGSQKSPGLYEFDSGFADTFSSIPPAPPSLIYPGDVENGDSGINMDDNVDMEPERDCVKTHGTMQTTPDVPMEFEDATKLLARGSCSRPPAANTHVHTVTRSTKRPVGPRVIRVPKKTMSTSSTSTHSITNSHVRNVTFPPQQRSSRPRSTSPRSAPHPSTSTTTTTITTGPSSTTHTYTYSHPPFTTDKENQGPSTMPVLRSNSPLTCNNNNFRSLQNVDRVPPMSVNASIDIYQLREYMAYFLPDTKEGDT